MTKVYTADEVNDDLKAAVAEAGSEAAFCDDHKLIRVNVNRTTKGKIRPGGTIAAAVGYKRILLEAFVKTDDLDEYEPPEGYTLLPYNVTGGTAGGRKAP